MKTTARQQELLRGLNSLARKVFEATPIKIPWTVSEIRQELVRQGSHHDMRAIEGSLRNMYESGLVHYDSLTRKFRREPVRQEIAKLASVPAPVIALQGRHADIIIMDDIVHKDRENRMPVPPPKSPLDIILELSERAKQLVIDATKLRSDLDDAGIALQKAFEIEAQKSTQLSALKALLRD